MQIIPLGLSLSPIRAFSNKLRAADLYEFHISKFASIPFKFVVKFFKIKFPDIFQKICFYLLL